MTTEKMLMQGRQAFHQKLWADAYKLLSKANKDRLLKPKDMEFLAIAAYLSGRSSDSNDIWVCTYNAYLENNNIKGAVRAAFWLGFTLLNKGESARGGGWIGLADRLLKENQVDSVENGYLILPVALQLLRSGDASNSFKNFENAGKIGESFRDTDLITLSRLGRGQALIKLKEIDKGVSFLDEAMATVESGQVSAIVSGIVYCAVIEACLEIYDLQRAREWTNALTSWCESQPHLVPFRGQCLIRRSEILQLHGEWPSAKEEAYRATEVLNQKIAEPLTGYAYYQLGELYRLQGEFIKADEVYHQASKNGYNPQPGLSLLRLAQKKEDIAVTLIITAEKEAKDMKTRSKILPAFVEIMLAVNKIQKAHNALVEFMQITNELNAPFLHGTAAYAEGTILLKKEEEKAAIKQFVKSKIIWEKLRAPYLTARTRLMTGIAYLKAGDKDTANLEFEAARYLFDQLNATPDVAETDSYLRDKNTAQSCGLSHRELEVLLLIAQGKSNKAVANELYISERTVERHVSNIFSKLHVSSRSAATAFAYKNQFI